MLLSRNFSCNYYAAFCFTSQLCWTCSPLLHSALGAQFSFLSQFFFFLCSELINGYANVPIFHKQVKLHDRKCAGGGGGRNSNDMTMSLVGKFSIDTSRY